MKNKLLCCALLAGIGMAQSAAAQSYDDRWYIGGGVGVGFFDKDRDAADHVYGMIGLGKMITPHISIDAELWHSNPDVRSGVIGALPDPVSGSLAGWAARGAALFGLATAPGDE